MLVRKRELEGRLEDLIVSDNIKAHVKYIGRESADLIRVAQ
jgi:hypothetical protein